MASRRTLTVLVIFGLAAWAWSPIATARVHRCVKPNLEVVFTDRPCAAFGAVERRVQGRDAGNSGNRRIRHRGCARTVPDLLFEVRQAIRGRDVNRLAGVYHWRGMSTGAATRVMQRLSALVRRPLVGVVAVMSQPDLQDPMQGRDPAVEVPPPRPVALRIEQTLANGITPSRTVFGLKKYFGCVWISG